jgi:hypothetical protein
MISKNNKIILTRVVDFYEDFPGHISAPITIPYFIDLFKNNEIPGKGKVLDLLLQKIYKIFMIMNNNILTIMNILQI